MIASAPAVTALITTRNRGKDEILAIPAYAFFRRAFWPPLWDILRLRNTQITHFLMGFAQAWRTPLDKTHLFFIPLKGLPDFVSAPSRAPFPAETMQEGSGV